MQVSGQPLEGTGGLVMAEEDTYMVKWQLCMCAWPYRSAPGDQVHEYACSAALIAVEGENLY